MAALLLTDGRVHRPFNWIFSLSTDNLGSGDDPILKVVEWADEMSYQTDVASTNNDHGSFFSVDVAAFPSESFDDLDTIFASLLALGGDYAGATQIA